MGIGLEDYDGVVQRVGVTHEETGNWELVLILMSQYLTAILRMYYKSIP
jgi:hypothetical protein